MIKVTYEIASTSWTAHKILNKLNKEPMLSFDTETAGVYSKTEREKAKKFLKVKQSNDDRKMLALIANNSGLSYPSIINVTHFIFGVSESHSKIIVCYTQAEEMFVWKWLAKYEGLLLIHGTMFDLKIMEHRVGKLPEFYEDTQLMARAMTNNAESWKARVGLKDLMGAYYHPSWSLFDKYEPDDLKDEDFLLYGATDGAATYKLYHLIVEKWLADE